MSIFQVISVCFALFMIYLISIHQKKKVLTFTESSAWISVWIVFIGLAVFPESLRDLVALLHFSRVFDLLLVMALMVLTVLVFVSYTNQRATDLKIENLVRSIAIKLVSSKHHRSRK